MPSWKSAPSKAAAKRCKEALSSALWPSSTRRTKCFSDRAEKGEAGAARVWEMIASGAIAVTVGQTYPLEEVARAHADLEARRTTGSTVLLL